MQKRCPKKGSVFASIFLMLEQFPELLRGWKQVKNASAPPLLSAFLSIRSNENCGQKIHSIFLLKDSLAELFSIHIPHILKKYLIISGHPL